MAIIVSDATVIDGVADTPAERQSLWIDGGRIRSIGRRESLGAPPDAQLIDGRGKFVIPGLMNANVHLLCDVRLESVARHLGRFDELIVEAAQVALKSGQTTVFDTWGPRKHLVAVRDRIAAGQVPGARIFCAGNIVGLDGPFSEDFNFFTRAMGATSDPFARRINAIWVENVGRHLMWLTPEQVAKEVRDYLGRGIDFVKYASNDHVPGAFLAFSPPAQELIVQAAHAVGTTAQAHTMSVEGLRIAIEAGCDLIQHANNTGPIPIPESTLELMARKQTGAVIFPYTQRRLEWFMKKNNSYIAHKGPLEWEISDINARTLIKSGIPLLLANDGAILAPEALHTSTYGSVMSDAPEDGSLYSLSAGHFYWFKAMEEKGCPPMQMLRAATRNIAVAYGKDKDLGTLEVGKVADLLVLDADPLASADNYRAIHAIVKDGKLVDREALPQESILTRPMDPPSEEEGRYTPFLSSGRFPGCGCH